MSASPSKDLLQRFLFPDLGCRGEFVRLRTSWQELLSRSTYPASVENALGQSLAAIALLSATIKFDGSLSLQINGDGPVSLLLVQARANGGLRGLARFDGERLAERGPLFGEARAAITIETGTPLERYQGVVEMDSGLLVDALQNYFLRSEQLATRLWLSATSEECAGILLQRLPGEEDDEEHLEHWRRVCMLTDTITERELHELNVLELLRRLYHEEVVQLLDNRELKFGCECSRERTGSMLVALGQDEVTDILHEQGSVEVRCEFCNAEYVFDDRAVADLFSGNN